MRVFPTLAWQASAAAGFVQSSPGSGKTILACVRCGRRKTRSKLLLSCSSFFEEAAEVRAFYWRQRRLRRRNQRRYGDCVAT
jgi:ribosomal protein L37E